MAHQKDSGYSTPYKFTAKELDEETGLYYFGARYYDPTLSIWHGVDPLADQFPSWNPYHYVHNNPILLTDPTGMKADTTRLQNTDGNWHVTDESISRTNTSIFNNGQTYTYDNELHFGTMSSKSQDEINKEIKIQRQPKIYQIGFTGSYSSMGFGSLFSIGWAWDTEGNNGIYTTYGCFAGFGGGIGFEFTKSKSIVEKMDFDIKELKGFGQNTNANLWYLNGAEGGNASRISDLISSKPSSYKSKTFGLSTLGFGLSKSYEYTHLFPFIIKGI